jgi:hypothetical protein
MLAGIWAIACCWCGAAGGTRWVMMRGPHVTFSNNCVDADPLFQAPPPRTFRLQEGSPAYQLGFKAIPFEKIGLYESEYCRVVVR